MTDTSTQLRTYAFKSLIVEICKATYSYVVSCLIFKLKLLSVLHVLVVSTGHVRRGSYGNNNITKP